MENLDIFGVHSQCKSKRFLGDSGWDICGCVLPM